MNEQNFIGQTVVRGVALSMRQNEDGDFELAWSGNGLDGVAQFAQDASQNDIWSQAIALLREDPRRDPYAVTEDAPDSEPAFA